MGAAVGRDGAVHGLDASGAMNVIAERRCADKPWVRIDEGDVLELPYADGTFDAAVSTQVYEYVADLPRALGELHRVLRPGGQALILTPTGTRWCGTPATGSCTDASPRRGRTTWCIRTYPRCSQD